MALKQVAVDTSVLIAALQAWHPEHERSARALNAVLEEPPVIVPLHALLETYSVLTRLPRRLRLSPETAVMLLERTLRGAVEIPELEHAAAFGLLRSFRDRDIAGGAVYDAWIAESAARAGAASILTLNRQHFDRLIPEGLAVIEP